MAKRANLRKAMLLQVPVLHRGFIDTIKGLKQTCDCSMDLVRRKEEHERVKRAKESVNKSRHEQKEPSLFESRHRRRLQLEVDAANLRVRLYGDHFKLPRSMKEKCLVARE